RRAPSRCAVLVDELRPDALDEVGGGQVPGRDPELLGQRLLERTEAARAAECGEGDAERGGRLRPDGRGELAGGRSAVGVERGEDRDDAVRGERVVGELPLGRERGRAGVLRQRGDHRVGVRRLPSSPGARDRSQVPPSSGTNPMVTSGKPSRERSVTTRWDAWEEMPMPPPSTSPSWTATTGLGYAAILAFIVYSSAQNSTAGS